MKTILFINGCVRGENSRTLQLANTYLNALKKMPDIRIVERNLSLEKLEIMTANSFDPTTGVQHPISPVLAQEFADADEIVLAAPFWEFLFPAIVNCYFEVISIAGVTFQYTDKGSVGLCKASRFRYIYTAGDYIREEDSISEHYLEKLTKLYGIEEFSVIKVDGLDIEGNDVEKMISEMCQNIQDSITN